MKPPSGPKKQTQTKPISPTPKGVKQKAAKVCIKGLTFMADLGIILL